MWTKICGIKDVETATKIAALGPQAMGLNFYAGTPRCVEVETAAKIVRDLSENIEPVGLFVNHSPAEIKQICRDCGIRTIQLHGDEPAELLAELTDLTVIRAFRIGDDRLDEMGTYLDRCEQLGCTPKYCLVDARVAGAYGGTGETVSWEMVAREYRNDAWPPLILSGGLNPQNVSEGIRICRPWGVDVSSGVESKTAVKDLRLVEEFIVAAHRAFESIEPNNNK